jgi:hypothetical protein
MNYLSYAGSQAFLRCTELGYFAHAIGWTEAMERLVALRQMCRPADEIGRHVDRVLTLQEWPRENVWPDAPESEMGARDAQAPGHGQIIRNPPLTEDEDPGYFYFLPGPGTGLQDWRFHAYDDDYHPSIPHGHWHGNARPKLDSYQGWKYSGSRQIGREPRSKIIALWNDADFRDFARTAIEYYLHHHPTYSGWPVPSPLRLPRRR